MMVRRMELTVPNMRRHVEQVSAAFGIAVAYNETLSYETAAAVQFDDGRLVVARPIQCEATYAIVMHEIGHHVAPNGMCIIPVPKRGCHPRERFEFMHAKMVCERAAWEWAQYYIEQVFYWTASMEQVKQYGLSTYEAGRRRGR